VKWFSIQLLPRGTLQSSGGSAHDWSILVAVPLKFGGSSRRRLHPRLVQLFTGSWVAAILIFIDQLRLWDQIQQIMFHENLFGLSAAVDGHPTQQAVLPSLEERGVTRSTNFV